MFASKLKKDMNELDLSILKYYKEGNELCGFEGVHDSLCDNGYLDCDLELTAKAMVFIKTYPDWASVKAFDNKTYISIKCYEKTTSRPSHRS